MISFSDEIDRHDMPLEDLFADNADQVRPGRERGDPDIDHKGRHLLADRTDRDPRRLSELEPAADCADQHAGKRPVGDALLLGELPVDHRGGAAIVEHGVAGNALDGDGHDDVTLQAALETDCLRRGSAQAARRAGRQRQRRRRDQPQDEARGRRSPIPA